jgi:hypothetical protein
MQMASLWTNEGSFSTGLSAWLAVLFGIGGTILAVTFLLLNIIRRDLRFGLGSTAFGLVVFNLTAFLLITLARADHIRKIPTELDAPRYYYWSSLFWAGLFLFGLRLGETPRFLRRLAILCRSPVTDFRISLSLSRRQALPLRSSAQQRSRNEPHLWSERSAASSNSVAFP